MLSIASLVAGCAPGVDVESYLGRTICGGHGNLRQLTLLVMFLAFAAACSSEENPGSVDPENVPSSSSSTIVTTRPVTFGDFETVGDGESLSLLVDVCDVNLANLEIVETDETITVAITEFFTPPTTNELGAYRRLLGTGVLSVAGCEA